MARSSRALRPPGAGLFGRAFVVQAALLVAMAWPRLVTCHLWAEDGSEFLPKAYAHGLASLALPYEGYYHLLPRLLAWVGSQLPLVYFAPFVAATFASPTYRWLLPNDWVRLGCGSFLLVAPGMWEVLGNLANLHTLGSVFLALVAWRNLRAPWPAWLWFAFVFALGSEGSAVVFALPMGWRLYLAAKVDARTARREAVALGLVLAWAVTHGLAARQQASVLVPIALPQLARAGGQLLVERWVVVPWAYAAKLTVWRAWPLGWRIVTGSGGLLGLAVLLCARSGRAALGICTPPAALLGTLLVTGLARAGAMEQLTCGWVGIYCRYGTATYLTAVILWAVALGEVSKRLGVELRPLAAALAFALASQWALPYQSFGKETDWQETGRALQHVVRGDGTYPRGHCVAHNPEGWTICLDRAGRD